MTLSTIPPAFAQATLNYVQVSSLLAKKALDELGVSRQIQKRAEDKTAGLVEHMVTIKTIKPTEKEAALRLLRNHAETLDLLKIAHDEIAKLRATMGKEAAANRVTPESGEGVSESDAGVDASGSASSSTSKAGEYNSLTDPRIGYRTSQKKASDIALARGLTV